MVSNKAEKNSAIENNYTSAFYGDHSQMRESSSSQSITAFLDVPSF